MKADEPMLSAGIDIGSSAAKIVVFRDRGDAGGDILAAKSERIRRRDPRAVAEELFEACLAEAGAAERDLTYVATTGEGEMIERRTGHFYGMTTHARGGLFLDPSVRAVIDIGALHTRAVTMDEHARVLGYRMTSQCASGSGQFLENICRYLGITMDEIGPLSLQGDDPEACSSICAVLAETDVINMVSRGIKPANIIRGIHVSMAGRYVRLLVSSGARGKVLVTGGLAADVGLIRAMEDEGARQKAQFTFGAHPKSVFAGALGAAIWGAFRARRLMEKGISLGVRETV